jgi:hypothetical protein
MNLPPFCHPLRVVPKYHDMTPEEKERCYFLRVVLDGATMICEHFDFCATSPTWAPRGMCFSKEHNVKINNKST